MGNLINEKLAEIGTNTGLLVNLANEDLDQVSTSGGTQKITLSSGSGQGSNQVCRSCLVKPDKNNTEDVYVNIGSAADANDMPLDSIAIPIPVDNLNKLYFYSADVDAIVYILWRN